MMRARMGLMAMLLALAACGDEDKAQTGYTPSNDKASTSAGDTAATPARAANLPDTLPHKAPPQDTFAIALAPVEGATVRGTGRVAAVGKSTSIAVALTQGIRGATYEGAVRQGICAGMGSSVASLLPVSADSLGSGRASSDVVVPIDSLTSRPHVVVYGRGGRPEACAQLGPAIGAPAPPSPPRPQTVPYADTLGPR
jgi:hypothetical protein